MLETDKRIAKKVAEMLLECGAVKLSPAEPFTWASGWKSPIYCDNRVTLSYPEIRNFIKHSLSEEIARHFPLVEAVAGVATAGIPQGALVADEIGLPFAYVRAEAKKHGMKNLIEGKLPAKSRTVVIEDLISTGLSSLKAVAALKGAGLVVIGMGAVFTYGFVEAESAITQASVPAFALTNYQTLIEVALEQHLIQDEQLATLNQWRQTPALWP
jgi:orotate phosphoribosyltransferase